MGTVTNVEDIPEQLSSEELDQVEVRANSDDQLGAFPMREEEGDVLGDPGCGNRLEGYAEAAQPLLAGA